MPLQSDCNLKQHREDGPELLVQHINSRMQQLGYLNSEDLQQHGGPSGETIRKIEKGIVDAISRHTAKKITDALRWTVDSVDRIIKGDDPVDQPPAEKGDIGFQITRARPRAGPQRAERLYELLVNTMVLMLKQDRGDVLVWQERVMTAASLDEDVIEDGTTRSTYEQYVQATAKDHGLQWIYDGMEDALSRATPPEE